MIAYRLDHHRHNRGERSVILCKLQDFLRIMINFISNFVLGFLLTERT